MFDRPTTRTDVWHALAVASVATLAAGFLQLRVGLSLGDETWAWYGVQRTLAGEVPLRDFQSYDPGRYWLFAGWMRLCRTDHLVALRSAMAILQWTALVPALLLLLRVLPARWLVWPFGIGLSLWVAPRHKTIDVNAVTWTMLALVALVERPDRRRHVGMGVVVGLLWLVGRNHVLYAGLATAIAGGAIALADRTGWRHMARRARWVAGGTVVGALPMVVALIGIPGYLRAYWMVVVRRQMEIGATNLTLPVPWPWRCPLPWTDWAGLTARATGAGFVAMAVVPALLAPVLIRMAIRRQLRSHATLLVATAATVGWANHALSRADLPHLAQAGVPLFILLIAVPAAVPWGRSAAATRAVCYGLVAGLTAMALPALNPVLSAAMHPAERYAWTSIAGETLFAPARERAICSVAARALAREGTGATALFLPYQPGLYAVFRLRCPMFESYPVYPAGPTVQRSAIDDLARADVRCILFWPDRIDGRADLGFDRTDALVWQYLRERFELVETVPDAGGVQIWRRKR